MRDYRRAHGLSHAELAKLLSERLGREVKTKRVFDLETASPGRTPKVFLEVLGVERIAARPAAVEQPSLPGADGDTVAASTGDEQPGWAPQPPPGTIPMVAPPEPAAAGSGDGGLGSARERIAKAYAAIGAGASMVTHNDGFAAVTDGYKDELAKAWIDAARENQNVAKIVAFMESGGPVGELVVCHLLLVFGFVYVSGRAPALGTIYGGKFAAFHDQAAAGRSVDEQLAASGGADASGNGYPGSLADAGAFAQG